MLYDFSDYLDSIYDFTVTENQHGDIMVYVILLISVLLSCRTEEEIFWIAKQVRGEK